MRLMELTNKETQKVEKNWLKSYPPGVPEEINPDAYQSIVEVLEESFQKYGDRPAYYSMGTTLTYAEIDKLSDDFASYLQNDLSVNKGDRIAIMLPNILQYPVAMFAALKIGAIIVNVNPLYTPSELAYQLNDSGAETIIVLANFAHTAEKAKESAPSLKNVVVTYVGDLLPTIKAFAIHLALKYYFKKLPQWNLPKAHMFKDALAKGAKSKLKHVDITNTDIAFLQYTGGTTGVSKGAVLTHRNMIANLEQGYAWFSDMFLPGEEVIITALPLYHIFSLLANCLLFTKLGGLNVLISNPRDIPGMIKDMKRFSFTAITGVNTLFGGLLKDPNFAELDFSRLHLTLGGGMAVQEVVADRWQEVTGKPLLEAYGLTETSPCVSINPENLASYNGSIGLPVSSTVVAILDDEGNVLPAGQHGELAIKGPQVMQGYWNNPVETAKVFTDDGWLLTGDVASLDEKGYIKIHERKKDMILVSGFNVYPNEVEGVIVKLPGIVECAVVGVPDENSGEAVKAFIVKDNPSITEQDVTKHCRQSLTPYKVPKIIEFCDELPKSNVGKILRRKLRENA